MPHVGDRSRKQRPGLAPVDAVVVGHLAELALVRQRLEQFRDRLRRLDLKLPANVPHAGLVRMVREEVEQVVVNLALRRRERLGHVRLE